MTAPATPGDGTRAMADDWQATCLSDADNVATLLRGVAAGETVTVEVDVPADDAELQRFVEDWSGGGNPRASLGV